MELLEACRFLSDISGIGIIVIESESELNSFCKKHYFHHAQDQFKRSYLSPLCKELKENTILFMEDRLLIKFVIIKTENNLIFLGPYVSRDMTQANVSFLKKNNDLDDLVIEDYRAYRDNYLLKEDSVILHDCLSLLAHTGHDPYSFSQEHNYDERASLSKSWEYQRKNFENLINERYRVEQEMMEQIAEGDDVAAIQSYRKIHNNVKHMGDFGSTPDLSRISSGITRATVRMAAVEAGLPPMIIDNISGESSRTISRLNTREEMYRENERMIRAFAKAIAQYRKNHYSSLVYSAIDHFGHNYNKDLSIQDVADHLGVSISCLINKFKKETGKTPSAYLCDFRIQKAKRMLRTSHFTIQQIAEDVGIFDANYFVKCFRKITGTTPSAYRKGYYNNMAAKKPISH